MRRRRLYRIINSQECACQPQPLATGGSYPETDSVSGGRRGHEFDRGVRHGIGIAMQQHQRMAAEVHRKALEAARGHAYLIMANRREFDEGWALGRPSRSQAGGEYTHGDMSEARRIGFEEGRASAMRTPCGIPSEASIRKKAVDDMLENCRVIAESNPNMDSASFLKAVRHRSKKMTTGQG